MASIHEEWRYVAGTDIAVSRNGEVREHVTKMPRKPIVRNKRLTVKVLFDGAEKKREVELARIMASTFANIELRHIGHIIYKDKEFKNCKYSNLNWKLRRVLQEPPRKMRRAELELEEKNLNWKIGDVKGVSYVERSRKYVGKISYGGKKIGGRETPRIYFQASYPDLEDAIHFRLTVERRLFDLGHIHKLDNKEAAGEKLELLRSALGLDLKTLLKHANKNVKDLWINPF